VPALAASQRRQICAFGNKRLEHLHRCVELRVLLLCETLGLLHERSHGAAIVEAGCGLDVDRIRLVGIIIEYLLFKPIGIGREPIAQRACRCGGR